MHGTMSLKVTDKFKLDFKKTREECRSLVFSLMVKGRFVSPEFSGLHVYKCIAEYTNAQMLPWA